MRHAIAISLFVTAVVLASITIEGDSANVRSSYLLKSRSIGSKPEALRLLRQMLSIRFTKEERCQAYAVLLYEANSNILNQFSIAELSLEPAESISNKFKQLKVEQLRDLYMEGIQSFNNDIVDASMLELVDCLSDKYRKFDAKARSFLNNQALKDTLSQYNEIKGLPLNFILNPEAQHPFLRSDQMTPSIVKTVLDVFNGDSQDAQNHFPPSTGETAPPTPAQASRPVEPTVTVATPPTAPASPLPVQPQPYEAPKSAPTPRPVQKSAEIPSQPEPEIIVPPPAPVKQGSPQQTGPVLNSQLAAQVSPGPEPVDEELLEYLNLLSAALSELYLSLPVESKIGDRCKNYVKLIQAQEEQLTPSYVEELSKQTAAKIATEGPALQPYVPEKVARDEFLYTFSALNPKNMEQEVYADVANCISQWDSVTSSN